MLMWEMSWAFIGHGISCLVAVTITGVAAARICKHAVAMLRHRLRAAAMTGDSHNAGRRHLFNFRLVLLGIALLGLPGASNIDAWVVPRRAAQRILWSWKLAEGGYVAVLEVVSGRTWLSPLGLQMLGPTRIQPEEVVLYYGSTYPLAKEIGQMRQNWVRGDAALFDRDVAALLTQAGSQIDELAARAVLRDVDLCVNGLGRPVVWHSWQEGEFFEIERRWIRDGKVVQLQSQPNTAWEPELLMYVHTRPAPFVFRVIYLSSIVSLVMRRSGSQTIRCGDATMKTAFFGRADSIPKRNTE